MQDLSDEWSKTLKLKKNQIKIVQFVISDIFFQNR